MLATDVWPGVVHCNNCLANTRMDRLPGITGAAAGPEYTGAFG